MLFSPSSITYANTCRCSLNTPNVWVINAGCTAVECRFVSPTLGVVRNTEGYCKFWNLSCISVRSLLPISVYMGNISTWSANHFVTYHFKWSTWPGRGINSTAFCGGCTQESTFSFPSSGRRVSLDVSSSLCLEYSTGLLRSIGKNVPEPSENHSIHQRIQWPVILLLSGMLLRSSMSPNTSNNYGSCHLWTLHAPKAPHEVYLSTKALRLACPSSIYRRWMRCTLSFGIWTSGFPLASFDSDHHLFIQGLAICIVQCATSYWASSSSVQTVYIIHFTAEYNASAPCFSITVSSTEPAGATENCDIVWPHQS